MCFEEIVEGGIEKRGADVVRGIKEEQAVGMLEDLEREEGVVSELITALRLEVEDFVLSFGEMEEVSAGPAAEDVVAVTTSKDILAFSAVEGVVVASTAESVVFARAAEEISA